MPITISYDLTAAAPHHRNYVRSMLERFAWERLGGSVFRYTGRVKNKKREEDWLNDVVPALMFFRSYIIKHEIQLKFFTLDTSSIARIDFSDAGATLGNQPLAGEDLLFKTPSNIQSSVKRIRRMVDVCVDVLI